MLVLKFANVGAGKTTDLTRVARKELKKIKKGKSPFKYVVANTPVHGVYYCPDLRDILKNYVFEDTLLLIDEASIVYNNRLMKMTDKEIEYFKLHRHYLCNVYVWSQAHDDVDITLRRMYERIYLMNRTWFGFTRTKRIFRTTDIVEGELKDAFSFGNWLQRLVFKRYMYRPFYYKYFNTHWRPDNVKYFNVETLELVDYQVKYLKDTIKQDWITFKDKFKNRKDKKEKVIIEGKEVI